MNDMLAFLLMASFGVMAINVPVYFFLLYKLNSYMRVNHHALWERKGSLGILANNSISNSSSMVVFILSRGYLKSDDQVLHERGTKCRASLLLGMGGFALGITMLFAL